MKHPCIVAKRNNNPNDPRPHGQIISLYTLNHEDIFGEGSIDMMLEAFKAGTGHLYEYIRAEIDQESILIKDGLMYHPEFHS